MTKYSSQDLATRAKASNFSCTSMVVTLFGDVISQHGGWIWLGSLIDILSKLGYNERLVRTAVFRLVQQDWLQVNKVGRKSYYCLTDSAKRQYERSAMRIYSSEPDHWDGTWTLVSLNAVPESMREEFRKRLIWQGYNQLVPGFMAHPSGDRGPLNDTIQELNLVGTVLVFSAATTESHSAALLKALASEKWNLAELGERYSGVLDYYAPLVKNKTVKVSAQEALLIRLMLVHEYRRIVLKDPDFPEEMLPSGWVGLQAQALVKRLYHLLLKGSLDYIGEHFENAHGPVPHASQGLFARFGGLKQ